jgi:hypothetical protein
MNIVQTMCFTLAEHPGLQCSARRTLKCSAARSACRTRKCSAALAALHFSLPPLPSSPHIHLPLHSAPILISIQPPIPCLHLTTPHFPFGWQPCSTNLDNLASASSGVRPSGLPWPTTQCLVGFASQQIYKDVKYTEADVHIASILCINRTYFLDNFER